jgi:NAD(P)-dependent dehydrogenase (short-subunit alcohol dehydrogenase family)
LRSLDYGTPLYLWERARVRVPRSITHMAVVLITGCSSGFGLEFVSAFARRGNAVIATLRQVERADRLQQRVAAEQLTTVSIEQLDVTDSASVSRCVEAALETYGRIDVLVNNAGIGAVGALEVLDDATLRRVFDTNLFGAIAVTRAVLPAMRRQASGRVVFVNAIGGVLTTPYLGAYCASKHALDCVAATFDIELRPFGIRVSSVLPSAYQTAMAGNLHVDFGEGSGYEAATHDYFAGLQTRIKNGPSDLSPVADAVVEAATAPDPKPRYLVAPHLADVLDPILGDLERLHEREVSLAPRPR